VTGESEPFLLVRATELRGLPVVGITSGEALADVRDVVYSPGVGRVTGFSLNKHGGLLAGPLKKTLPLWAVWAVGRDAVMIPDDSAIDADESEDSNADDAPRNVLENQVLTDGGERLGEIDDLIVAAGIVGAPGPGRTPSPQGEHRVGDVVGYEVIADAHLQGRAGTRLLVPLPYTLAVSGETLMVPAAVEPFIRDDLAGFGAAVEEFRASLEGSDRSGSA
jgi:sporulation protein YlmC with PRC-barrel domain